MGVVDQHICRGCIQSFLDRSADPNISSPLAQQVPQIIPSCTARYRTGYFQIARRQRSLSDRTSGPARCPCNTDSRHLHVLQKACNCERKAAEGFRRPILPYFTSATCGWAENQPEARAGLNCSHCSSVALLTT